MKFPSLFYAVTLLMRVLQFASAVIVLGLAGLMLQKFDTSKSNLGRFSYTVCVAVFGMIAAPLTLLPRLNVLALTSVDLVMSLMWWAVFGLLFNFLGFPPDWVILTSNTDVFDDQYEELNTMTAFAFISAMLTLLSSIFDCFVDSRGEKRYDNEMARASRTGDMPKERDQAETSD
ncbi:integral membrane protein [Moelleriella libera RCEF 2490]|uniref:Integral membrane protein n=1 Tax=Moelleriella libera RCEF 2490 TaxID=1081109 RepID=A0A167W3E7_9HYPO|nr:integral membrane protein [Moelleriella libera RCEF 2490]